jgi:TPR repeat protein
MSARREHAMRAPRVRRWAATAALGATLFATVLAASPTLASEAGEASQFADAEYEVQHFASALAAYERAAQAGDVRAQEIAGLMCLYGGALYGDAVPRDLDRARRWFAMAAGNGSEVARNLLARWPTIAVTAR